MAEKMLSAPPRHIKQWWFGQGWRCSCGDRDCRR